MVGLGGGGGEGNGGYFNMLIYMKMHVFFIWLTGKVSYQPVCSVKALHFTCLGGESVGAVERSLLDTAGVDLLSFEELLKFKFPLSHPFCI